MTDEERDALLIRLEERVCNLTKQFSNHLRHHWMIAIPVVVMVLGLIAALLTK